MSTETEAAVSRDANETDARLEQMAKEIATLRQNLTFLRNQLAKLTGSITASLGE